jgi:hypothetical protein
MKKVVVMLMVLVVCGMVSLSYAGDVQRIIAVRDALGKRIAEVSGEISYRIGKVDSLGSCNARLAEMRRIALLGTEAFLLVNALKELDKMVFGVDLLAAVVRSGARLTEVNYMSVAELYNEVVRNAEDNLLVLVNCSFCSPESRQVARRALQVLREDWR